MQSDRNKEYMMQMWGTDRLITDYGSVETTDIKEEKKKFLQEIMNSHEKSHDFKYQEEIHQKIRNDEDYDDWSYGTEPTYGKKW